MELNRALDNYLKAKNITLNGAARAQEQLLEAAGLLDMPDTLAELEIIITRHQRQNAEAEAAKAREVKRGR